MNIIDKIIELENGMKEDGFIPEYISLSPDGIEEFVAELLDTTAYEGQMSITQLEDLEYRGMQVIMNPAQRWPVIVLTNPKHEIEYQPSVRDEMFEGIEGYSNQVLRDNSSKSYLKNLGEGL